MRIPIILAVAALVLSGCNANQEVNLSSQAAPGVVSGPNFPDYNLTIRSPTHRPAACMAAAKITTGQAAKTPGSATKADGLSAVGAPRSEGRSRRRSPFSKSPRRKIPRGASPRNRPRGATGCGVNYAPPSRRRRPSVAPAQARTGPAAA